MNQATQETTKPRYWTEFKGKKALITGGSRGIGKAIALELAQNGVDCVINYLRNEEAAKEVQKELQTLGVKAHLIQGNVGDPDEIKKLIQETADFFNNEIDIFVHNAALGAFKPVLDLKPNQWDMSFNINVKALYLAAKQLLPFMEGRNSKILSISSLGSISYIPDYGAIGISKAAMENLIRYLAVELAPKKIRVNAVSGGPIDTDALKMFPKYNQMVEDCLRRTPAGRLGTPQDIAKVIAFLCSEESRWIIGQTLIADGGMSLF